MLLSNLESEINLGWDPRVSLYKARVQVSGSRKFACHPKKNNTKRARTLYVTIKFWQIFIFGKVRCPWKCDGFVCGKNTHQSLGKARWNTFIRIWKIRDALEILSKLYSTMRRRMAWWNWWKSEATFERRSSLHSLRATQLLLIYIIFVNNFICFNYEK